MAYGISVKNSSGHILVSSETPSLHYAGDATLTAWSGVLGDFPNYNSPNDLTYREIYTYTIKLTGTSSTNVPVFFIRPNNYSSFHSILSLSNVGDTWTIKVLVSGGNMVLYSINVTGDTGQYTCSQLYTKVLGRRPDTEGLNYWVGQFGNTLTSANITTFKNAIAEALNTTAKQNAYAAAYGQFSLQRAMTFASTGGGFPQVAPQIKAFTKVDNIPVVGTVGVATYSANGTKLFDSRCNPLSILSAQAVITPTVPCDGGIPTISGRKDYAWNDTTLDFNFKSDTTFNSYSTGITAKPGQIYLDFMFSAPAVAQALYSRTKYGYKFSEGGYGEDDQEHWSTAKWWVLYHSVYRLFFSSSITTISAGWGMFNSGYMFSSTWSDGGFWGGDSGSMSGGDAPYRDATINLSSTGNTVIVANARNYE